MKLRHLLVAIVLCLTACSPAGGGGPDHIPVLMYHSVDETSRSPASVSIEEFTWQMEALLAAGFTAVKVADVERFLKGDRDLPPHPVLITFDDGYRSVYVNVFPVLQRLGLRAALFIIAGGRPGEELEWFHHAASGHMSWDELAVMVTAGVAEVHSHTYGLHRLLPVGDEGEPGNPLTGRLLLDGRVETEAEYSARVLEDLLRSRTVIRARLGEEALAFAFPWGEYTPEVVALVQEAGHKLLFTTEEGMITAASDPLALPRRAVYPGMSRNVFLSLLRPPGD
ncbi:MAG: polysaccharide deacetylase family protein [bacterium]|nr:polysaccharide deacetylase family protein [bacterium]